MFGTILLQITFSACDLELLKNEICRCKQTYTNLNQAIIEAM